MLFRSLFTGVPADLNAYRARLQAAMRLYAALATLGAFTLLFGAREAKDLYALDEIDAIARQWRGAFRFVPVLSAVGGTPVGAGEPATELLQTWLEAQLPPFAPDRVEVTEEGVLLSYRYASDPDGLVADVSP